MRSPKKMWSKLLQNLDSSNLIPTHTSRSFGRSLLFLSLEKPNPRPHKLSQFPIPILRTFSLILSSHTLIPSSQGWSPQPGVFSPHPPFGSPLPPAAAVTLLSAAPLPYVLSSLWLDPALPMFTTFLTSFYRHHISAGVDNISASTSTPTTHSRKSGLLGQHLSSLISFDSECPQSSQLLSCTISDIPKTLKPSGPLLRWLFVPSCPLNTYDTPHTLLGRWQSRTLSSPLPGIQLANTYISVTQKMI